MFSLLLGHHGAQLTPNPSFPVGTVPLTSAAPPDDHSAMVTAFDTATAVRGMENAGLSREKLATKTDFAAPNARMLEQLNGLQWRMVGLAAVIVAAVKLIP